MYIASKSQVLEKDLIQKWQDLVLLYQKARAAPTVRLWGKVILEIVKIFLSALLGKVFDGLLKDL